MDPLLTIVMPSYNYACYLREALDSILSQDFEDFELVILEDNSTDESPTIIRSYMEQDSRVKGIFHQENKGVLFRCNQGISLARGKYLHFLAADDYRYPGFLSKSMDILLKNPDVGTSYTQFHYGNKEKSILEPLGFKNQKEPFILEPFQMAEIFLKKGFMINSLSAIVKKALVIKNGCFDEDLYYLSDWFLLNKIIFQSKTAIIPEPLAMFRIHDSNFSNVYRHNKATKRAAYKNLLEKLFKKENSYLRKQIRKSGQLSFVFQDLFWKLLFNPKYLFFWPYVNKKYPISERFKKTLRKRLGIFNNKNKVPN